MQYMLIAFCALGSHSQTETDQTTKRRRRDADDDGFGMRASFCLFVYRVAFDECCYLLAVVRENVVYGGLTNCMCFVSMMNKNM